MAESDSGESTKESGQEQPQREKEGEDFRVMMETLTLNKPFRMRIKKSSLKIIYIEPRCQSVGKAAVGDTIVAIDGKLVKTWEELDAAMRQPTIKASVTFRRRAFSICQCKGTTVETLTIKNDPKVMRAIQLYSVRLVVNNFDDDNDEESELLGLQVAYDAKERLQITRTNQDSLAAVHLHSSDIIREVDGHAVSSKTMLRYWIMEGIEKRGYACLSVEAAVDSDEDEGEDMPEDVVEIARKQLQVHRSLSSQTAPKMRPILRKSGNSSAEGQRSIQICDSTVEIPIASDFDAKSLKRVKKGQH